MWSMSNNQFYAIFLGLLFIAVITECGILYICNYLNEIKELFEKQTNQESSKGDAD